MGKSSRCWDSKMDSS